MKYNNLTLVSLISILISCTPPQSVQEKVEETKDELIAIGSSYSATTYATSKAGAKLDLIAEAQALVDTNVVNEHVPAVYLDPTKQFQTIQGFGGALTDAAAETYAQLSEENQAKIMEAYFDEEKGLGYTFCRTHIHSCDFSSNSYTYIEEGDTALTTFDIKEDLEFKIPFIKVAKAIASEEFKLIASPWSPPAWMKTNNNMLQGGKLLPQYRRAWANYYIKFVDEYTKQGVPIFGFTVQNEPAATQTWESCIFTAEEERDFVRDYLGPAIANSDYPDAKLIIWDHNRGILYKRASTVYSDPEASKYVWGTGFHWYVGDHFENINLHTQAFPDKNLVFTEGCVFPFNMDNVNQWHWGERYGESILMDLENGAVAWIDWNILLNEIGGPNHVENYCFAPIVGDTQTDELVFMNSYYYMGHFSKFIKPGARRIISSSNQDDILATSFINKDSSIATVCMNKTDEDKRFDLWLGKRSVTVELPANSIVTVLLRT